ncbi:MAG TPA: tetratricopeptide repeat protein [Terriglobales bacterium]|nr:tetratricopeptide repeat protein [Terriglobales bacterium]
MPVLYRLRSSFLLLALAFASGILAGAQQNRTLDRQFQAAVTDYNSGKYAQAATTLEALLPHAPNSFEVHELLGLVYSAQQQNLKAGEQLEEAVRLNPSSAPARGNWATVLMRLGKLQSAEVQFRKAVALEPRNFDANHNLGEFYVQTQKLSQATPFLQRAQNINPASYDNGYDLALAYFETGKLGDARRVVQELLRQKDTAELHNLLAQVSEKNGDFITAAQQFQAAAHMEPSESNLFDWGSELLLHRTLDPAIQVFQDAAGRYPQSPRLAIGLGIALYSRGNYDLAVASLLRAADLNPSDPNCYYFLSKAYDSSPSQANEVIQHFRRFAELNPQNARAPYYYAMSLWKGRRMQDSSVNFPQIESLLKKSVALDPRLAEAHLQLANLYSDQKRYAESVAEYLQALAQNPELSEAHYRLAQAYVHTGRKDLAQEQFDLYQKARTQHQAELDRQRAAIRQFVYSAKNTGSERSQ